MRNAKIAAAIDMCMIAHEGQKRKYSEVLYHTHPIAVAKILEDCEGLDATDDMIIAAILHDTVEDTEMTLDQIDRIFGQGVARLVSQLTDVKKDTGTRKHRRKANLARLRASEAEVQTIKMADIHHNLSDFDNMADNDMDFAFKYLLEKYDTVLCLLEAYAPLRQATFEMIDDIMTKYIEVVRR